MRSFIDLSDAVENTERRFGSAQGYYPVTIVTGWRRTPALFTAAQVSEAIERAKVNPEDIPRVSLLRRVMFWLGQP